MLRIIQHRSIGFLISGIIVGLSLVAWLLWGLKPGLDFTGGSQIEVNFTGSNVPTTLQVAETVKKTENLVDVSVQPLGQDGMVIRTAALDENQHQAVVAALRTAYEKDGVKMQETQFDSIGPVIGKELQRQTIVAVGLAILAIVLYVTYVFRKVSYPISSWKYGVCTIVALLHDVVIPVGVLSALGHFTGLEVGSWVVTAILTVLGFSVHDTIVVFDRIRENLGKYRRENFEELVNRSINETLARSINTSLTVLLVLFATYYFGGATIKDFILTLLIGIAVGTYSSIFVASPLLVAWQLRSEKSR